MNCITHNHVEAVGNCGICGAGLCHDCFTGTFYTWNGKPLCQACNVRLVSELLAEAKAEAASAFIRFLFFAVAFAIGVIAAVATGEPLALVGLAQLGAIPLLWRLTRPTPSQALEYAVQDGVEEAFGDYSGGFIRLIVRILLVLFVAPFISPILFVVAIWKWRKAVRQVAELEADLGAMQEAGWRMDGTPPQPVPADSKKAAFVRAIHFAGPWKRCVASKGGGAAETPANAAPAAASITDKNNPVPPAAGKASTADDRIAARQAAVDARIAARKAALDAAKH